MNVEWVEVIGDRDCGHRFQPHKFWEPYLEETHYVYLYPVKTSMTGQHVVGTLWPPRNEHLRNTRQYKYVMTRGSTSFYRATYAQVTEDSLAPRRPE